MRCDEADALIDAFAEDDLDDARRAPLALHLAACGRCRFALDASRRLSVALASLPSAAPSADADARTLAAVEEERAWARWRTRSRRIVLAAGAAAAVAAVATAVFVATPAFAWASERSAPAMRFAESWLRWRAAPALDEARGTLVATLAVLVALAALDRGLARWDDAARRAR